MKFSFLSFVAICPIVQSQRTCGEYALSQSGFGQYGIDDSIGSVNLWPQCPAYTIEIDDGAEQTFIAPPSIHWHIYVLPDGVEPRYNVYPKGFLEKDIFDFALSFRYANSIAFDDPGQAAVELFVTSRTMGRIFVRGDGQTIEVTLVDGYIDIPSSSPRLALEITDTGNGNKIYVNMPQFALKYEASGTDAYLEAIVALEQQDFSLGFNPPDSSVVMSGTRNVAKIITDDSVSAMHVEMSGKEGRLTHQGGTIRELHMNGKDNFVLAGGNSCESAEISEFIGGTNNKCSPFASDIVLSQVDCLSPAGNPEELKCTNTELPSAATYTVTAPPPMFLLTVVGFFVWALM